MTKIILKTLPVALNATYKRGRDSFYKSTEAKDAQDAMAWEAKAQWKGRPLKGAVSLEIDLYYPDKRKDWDGGLKAISDALEGICYANDRQVEEAVIHKYCDPQSPRIEIVILSLV